MELRHVAAFAAVADELHFGRAAERLGIAQPALSRLIRRIEAELGVVLFERTSHRVRLTPAGTELLPHARALLGKRDELASVAAQLTAGSRAALRIGTTEPMGTQLAVLLDRFAAMQPDVRLELRPAHTPTKIAALRSGDMDIAFVREPEDARGLRVEPLWRTSLVAVLPASHPCAAHDEVDPADLEHLPLLLAPRSVTPGVHDALLAVVGTAASPTIPFERVQEALATVASGKAWTLMEAGAVQETRGVAVRALRSPGAGLRVALAWRPAGAAPAVKAFVAVARALRDEGALAG